MGGGASSSKQANVKYEVDISSEMGALMEGLQNDGNKSKQIETAMADQRLQKFAFEGEKPSWKDSYREYQTDRGVNKVANVEWSEQPAPPKERIGYSNSNGKMNISPQVSKAKLYTSSVTNPNVGKMAPPPNAGKSLPANSQYHEVINQSEYGAPGVAAPSALSRPTPPLESAPPSYQGGASQRSQMTASTGYSTVYSSAVPMAGRHSDLNLSQRRSTTGLSPNEIGNPSGPLIGQQNIKMGDMKLPNRRPSNGSDNDIEYSQRSNVTPAKPPPPAGAPPSRKLSREDSDVDGESVMLADFSISSKILENAAISATTARPMPSLNLAPVAAAQAIRNQQPPKPGATGLHTKPVPGMKLHSHYVIGNSPSAGHGHGRQLPTAAPPPSGPVPVPSQRGTTRGVPVVASPAAMNSTDLIAKKFPHAVKETNDVKRNKAQIPSQLTHAKPTTGDWLKKRYIVNNYILLDTLGTGSYGEVRLCKDRNTDKLYAIKILSKDFLKKKKQGKTSETYEEDIRREIAIMKKLLHPNVLRLFEVLDDPNVNKLYLVLEYMKKGDLIHFLNAREKEAAFAGGVSSDDKKKSPNSFPPVTDRELWIIFRQVCQGLKYLHHHNIIHGDIKPQNLLMGEDGVIRIADFGISIMLEDAAEKLQDANGTPAFMSPELCNNSPSVSGQLADVWAIGATMFMLRFGFPPFVAGTIYNLYQKIINDPLVFPAQIDPSLADLLEHMLEKAPEKRYTLDEVFRHPWMKQPPTNYAPPKTNIGNFGEWPPAPSYNKEEEDAMNSPVKTADNNDVFMSIMQNTKTDVIEGDDGKEKDEDDDLMATNWGMDVFDKVDDDFDSGSEDEIDSIDESKSVSVKKKPAIPTKLDSAPSAPKNSEEEKRSELRSEFNSFDSTAQDKVTTESKTNESAQGKIDSSPLLEHRTASFMNRQKMDEAEEVKRAMRFQKLNKQKRTVTYDSDSDYSDDDDSGSKKTKENDPMFDTMVDRPTRNSEAPLSQHSAPALPAKQPGVKPQNPLRVQLNSRDDTDENFDELSMDDFNSLMDTLSNPLQRKSQVETPTSQSPMVLSSVKIQEGLCNVYNAVGSAFHTEKGERPHQEDRCLSWPNIPPWSDVKSIMTCASTREADNWSAEELESIKKISIFGLFDGHSGSTCSEYLQANLIPMILQSQDIFGKKPAKLISETFAKIDEEVCAVLRRETDTSGSTALVALYDGRYNTFTAASTGDSMIVLSRAGRAVRMHKMHRLDDLDECERIRKAGGTILNRRVNGLLAISRALGDTQFKGVDGQPTLVIATPEVQTEVVTPMTEFAILATDGLWDVMEAQDAVHFVRKRLGKKIDIQVIVKDIVAEALHRGSVDNVTAIIVVFNINNPSPGGKAYANNA